MPSVTDICADPLKIEFALIVAMLAAEFWLGKTPRTKSGSIVELVLTSFVALTKALTKKKEK
jgi:hypothetical protein